GGRRKAVLATIVADRCHDQRLCFRVQHERACLDQVGRYIERGEDRPDAFGTILHPAVQRYTARLPRRFGRKVTGLPACSTSRSRMRTLRRRHRSSKSTMVQWCTFGVSYHSYGSASETGMRPNATCRRALQWPKFGKLTITSRPA